MALGAERRAELAHEGAIETTVQMPRKALAERIHVSRPRIPPTQSGVGCHWSYPTGALQRGPRRTGRVRPVALNPTGRISGK
jgi:hypothetical protein